jgi:alpha,alpha-trehalose-phosphate synthase [UDP-forming]
LHHEAAAIGGEFAMVTGATSKSLEPTERRPSLVVEPEIQPRKRHDLLVVSNRMPAPDAGHAREVGGLVSALEPALRDRDALWLGWSGEERRADSKLVIDANQRPARAHFDLPDTARQQFYAGFCNSALWPLFHGFTDRVRARDDDWQAYVRANERYARHAVELARPDGMIWAHDYHLLLVARALRRLGYRGDVGLFVHIPFPVRRLLQAYPWGMELVRAMLEFDLIGFQTEESAQNFVAACHGVPEAACDGDAVRCAGREVSVGVFPATICPEPFRQLCDDAPEVTGLRRALGGQRLILGVDRLDYSKGIPERLDGYARLLERFPGWRSQVCLLQIAVPSRTDVPEYVELRQIVEDRVAGINHRFGDADWSPVRACYRAYDRAVLAQLYRMADVALVTPLRDGMNLVAKEFVAAQQPSRPGVLVLSQYAGAADTLTSAVIANPFDPDGLAGAIDHALRMPVAERVSRCQMLQGALRREGDARAWAQRFLDRLQSGRPRG